MSTSDRQLACTKVPVDVHQCALHMETYNSDTRHIAETAFTRSRVDAAEVGAAELT
jgi:hypothetical protein